MMTWREQKARILKERLTNFFGNLEIVETTIENFIILRISFRGMITSLNNVIVIITDQNALVSFDRLNFELLVDLDDIIQFYVDKTKMFDINYKG